jgi:hypothetical protein
VSHPRRLFRSEPASIYEHVRRHLRADGPGLLEGGETLPDDEFLEGDVRWAPGALEGAFSRYGGEPDDVSARVDELHRALIRFADKPGRRERARVRRLFRENDVRTVVDDLLGRLRDHPPADQKTLYRELRRLLTESGYRGEVKFALALVGAFGQPDDVEIFRTLARHEEFTLYGAVALASVVDDPTAEWLALLQHVEGWGRTELAELLLRQPTPEVCAVLLRRGLGIGNALELAVGCKLHEALAGEVDDELLEGARHILDALTWAAMQPEDLLDYPDAGTAVVRFLEQLEDREPGLAEFVTVYELRQAVAPDQHDTRDPTAAGLDAETSERIDELAASILDRPEWAYRARQAMESESAEERNEGLDVAKRLGLPVGDYLVDQIERSPYDPRLWFEYVSGADERRLEEALELAERVWSLSDIATGPALELFGPPPDEAPHQAFDMLLQELPRFPGKGRQFVAAALRSAVIRHRHKALLALSRWPGGLDAEHERAVRAAAADPDDGVRQEARKVLAGESLEEPVVELDSDQ